VSNATSPRLRALRQAVRLRLSWRAVRWSLAGALVLVVLAHPVARAASDVFQNVAPPSQLQSGALSERYPLGNYALDHHFSAASFSITGGIDISGVPALIAYFLADVIWQLTAFLANALITLFTFAFSLDLVNGSAATGGAGALQPVAQAVRSIYSTTFGAPWLVVAIVLAGMWAMWKALVQRRYTETAGALGLSLIFCLLALWFVTQPEQTIGQASRWSNDMSAAFLSLSSNGSVGNEQQAKQQASDQLFRLLVYQPWVVLNFGGLEHCVKTPVDSSNPQSVPVRPLSSDPARDAVLSQQLRSGTEVQADGKVCINNENKYAPHFLAYSPESDPRNAEYDALSNGDASKLPDSDPGKQSGTYQLSAADKPAADAMGKGGQYQRLLMAVVVFAGELGAFLLLGVLSVAVILAQVLVLLLLAFAPVALVIGVYPGRGHDFFRGWLSRLATFLLRKAIYSLILAVLLAVAAAVGDATSNLGWLLSFGLEAAFFWAVFLYRHQLTGQLTAATTGTTVKPEEGTLKLAILYAAGRLATRALRERGGRGQPPPPPPYPDQGQGAGAPAAPGQQHATDDAAAEAVSPAGPHARRAVAVVPSREAQEAEAPSGSREQHGEGATAGAVGISRRAESTQRARHEAVAPSPGEPPPPARELAVDDTAGEVRSEESRAAPQGASADASSPAGSQGADAPGSGRQRPDALAEQLRQDAQRLRQGAADSIRPQRVAPPSSPAPTSETSSKPAPSADQPDLSWPQRPLRPGRAESER
jgi:hypothetical protein